MDGERLAQLATEFAKELQTSDELRSHVAEHQRRIERAQRLLTLKRIPTLGEEELKELFFDTDAFGFWTNKEWEFKRRVAKVGVDGLRNALLELIERAERGLSPEDLKAVWAMKGLGMLLSTNLLCYRFPDRYWTYSPNVTLPAFRVLGLDVKATLPRGQKSDAYVYLALREPMDQVVAALQAAGLSEADYSVADIFLWHLQSTNGERVLKLSSLLRHVLTSQGLHFTDWQIATFYTALQTKGFVILSGISGTGKTKLAQHFAALLPQPPGQNWLFVPVRPDWRDSKSLLGYYNPLTGTYAWTPFLRFLLRAERSYRTGDGLAWFVILDEMNLAHVEYYFADLLSVLESGRDEEGWTREPLRFDYPDEAEGDLPPRELHLPPNLYMIGTVNVDETTRAFSPKVLDRAFTLELTEADFDAYPLIPDENPVTLNAGGRQTLLNNFTFGGCFVRIDKQAIAEYVTDHPEVRERLKTLNEQLRPYGLHFGYRVFDEIVAFLIAAQHNHLYDGLGGVTAALDAAVLMKVLPKFHGSRSKLEAPLKAVLAWCVDPDAPAWASVEKELREVEQSEDVAKGLNQLPDRLAVKMRKTADRVRRMLWDLYTTGFAAFG